MGGLPAGFGGSLGLDLSSPSTAVSQVDAAPISNEGWTGPFAVGSGASARQTNAQPVSLTNSPAPSAGAAALAGVAGNITPSNIIVALVAFLAILVLKKKGIV